jgi:hypothetical protein
VVEEFPEYAVTPMVVASERFRDRWERERERREIRELEAFACLLMVLLGKGQGRPRLTTL